MTSRILIDANVPIDYAGRPHPLQEPSVRILQLAVNRPEAFYTDAEVFQELLHRCLALHAWTVGEGVFARFAVVIRGSVEAIRLADVQCPRQRE
jgi:predicted nucleic acid-binding protein